ncbi:MAG: guanylate kinase [Candidatus Dormiibacterota bacterium]|jgi:guanylate kinase
MTRASGPGRIIVLSGPSAVGKDTVIKKLLELSPSLKRPPAYTTRQPRPGEIDGRDYTFVSPETFGAMEAAKQFLETARVHGNCYGTSRALVQDLLDQGDTVLLKIDVQGAAQLRDAGLDAIFIFLEPPSRAALAERRQGRETETPEEIAIRTRDADRELAEARWYHHRVVNDDVDRAAGEVAAILEESPSGAS